MQRTQCKKIGCHAPHCKGNEIVEKMGAFEEPTETKPEDMGQVTQQGKQTLSDNNPVQSSSDVGGDQQLHLHSVLTANNEAYMSLQLVQQNQKEGVAGSEIVMDTQTLMPENNSKDGEGEK